MTINELHLKPAHHLGFVLSLVKQGDELEDKNKQGNYSLRRPPKLTIPQAVIGQRLGTVNSNLYKQPYMYVCMTHIPALTPS